MQFEYHITEADTDLEMQVWRYDKLFSDVLNLKDNRDKNGHFQMKHKYLRTKHERLCHLNTCVFKSRAPASISPTLVSHKFIFSCRPSFSVQKLTSSDVFENPSICSAGLRRAPPTGNMPNRRGQPPKTALAKRQHTTALNTRTRPRLTWWVLQSSSLSKLYREAALLLLVFFLTAFNPLTLFSSHNGN